MTHNEAITKLCPKTGKCCWGSDCACWIWTKQQDYSRGPSYNMKPEEWLGQCGFIQLIKRS